MKQYFEFQCNYFPEITEEVLEKAEFKTVWSGKRLIPGDKIVYAYVYVPNTDDLKAITFLERELNEIGSRFRFIKFYDEDNHMPVIAFNDDPRKRN